MNFGPLGSSNYIIEMEGRTFGELTVIRRDNSPTGEARWFCKCSCGQLGTYRGSTLRSGRTTVCGKMHGKIVEDEI